MTGNCASRFPLILTAIIMLAQFSGISGAAEWGRLFTTPEERSLLEKLRNPPTGTSHAPPADDPAKAQKALRNGDFTVGGLVYRKNGRSTVWINTSHIRTYGPRVQKLQINADISHAGDVLIKISDGKAIIRLRPEEMHYAHIRE